MLVRNRRRLVLPSNSLGTGSGEQGAGSGDGEQGAGSGGLRTLQTFLSADHCWESAGLGLRACLGLAFLGGFKAYAPGIK